MGCRATNKWGSAYTKATLVCKSHKLIDESSQVPGGMTGEKLKELEASRIPDRPGMEPEEPMGPPKFTLQVVSQHVGEGDHLHLEARVEPKNDVNLKVVWYHNGGEMKAGHRFK